MTAHISVHAPICGTCHGAGCDDCYPSMCGCGERHIDEVEHTYSGKVWHPDCCPRCRLTTMLGVGPRTDDDYIALDRIGDLIDNGALTDDEIDEVIG